MFGSGKDGRSAAVVARRGSAYDPAMAASTAAATASREPPVAAYAACRRLLRRHDPTYYLAVLRLPADVRPAVHALYGFVRGADEIVDGAGRSVEPAARLAALDAWERVLERGLAGGTSDHPVIAALVDAGLRLELPLDELRGYIRSMRVDCGRVRIATRAELDRYMDGSAASVGRVMAAILGARREAETFGRLGVAFQLTNFVRDVRVDYGLDRIYLPAEELERFGVDAAALGLGVGDASASRIALGRGRPGACALRRDGGIRRRCVAGGAARHALRACRLPLRPRPRRGGRLRRPRALDPPRRVGHRAGPACRTKVGP